MCSAAKKAKTKRIKCGAPYRAKDGWYGICDRPKGHAEPHSFAVVKAPAPAASSSSNPAHKELTYLRQYVLELERLAGEFVAAYDEYNADDFSTGRVMGVWRKLGKRHKALRGFLEQKEAHEHE